jgi:hypothetical protein
MLRGDDSLIIVGGRPLTLTVYEDTSGAVTLGLAALALSRAALVDEDDTRLLEDLPATPVRYRRADVADYVTHEGMPPHVKPIDT